MFTKGIIFGLSLFIAVLSSKSHADPYVIEEPLSWLTCMGGVACAFGDSIDGAINNSIKAFNALPYNAYYKIEIIGHTSAGMINDPYFGYQPAWNALFKDRQTGPWAVAIGECPHHAVLMILGTRTCVKYLDFEIISADPIDNPAPKNGGIYYSIPAVGQTNQTDRYFKLKIVKGPSSQLTGVKVELGGDSAGRLMEVAKTTSIPDYNRGIWSENESATAVTLYVRVSITNPTPSSVQGTPPPANNISYRFVVSGFNAASNYVENEILVSDKHALWRGASIFRAVMASAIPVVTIGFRVAPTSGY